jgi:predicted transcriptional regulator
VRKTKKTVKARPLKVFRVTEVITETRTTEYEVEATSEAEARKNYKQGQYLGDWSGGDKDGVTVREVKNGEG